jgi:lysozyme
MRNRRYFADVSNNNSAVQVAEYAKAGHVLLATKASEGVSFIDGKHAGWARWAHAEGLTVLHYHFARPDAGNNPAVEAGNFARAVRPLLKGGDYLCLDWERKNALRGFTATTWCEAFCREVKRLTGHTPIVYASESVFKSDLLGLHIPGGRYWVAKYGPPPADVGAGRKVWGWQYTNGQVGNTPHGALGIGSCDMSVLNRRTAVALQLRAWRRRRSILHKAGK